MEPEDQERIKETVLNTLKSSNLEEATEYKIRQMASEKLGLDLSQPDRKRFVRKVVEAYLSEQQYKTEPEPDEEKKEDEDDDEEARGKRKSGGGAKEWDENGDLIICKLSERRRVTVQEYRGKTLVSMREYYKKDGKELPGKGISLNSEQWSSFKKNVPVIEKAIRKMQSRLN